MTREARSRIDSLFARDRRWVISPLPRPSPDPSRLASRERSENHRERFAVRLECVERARLASEASKEMLGVFLVHRLHPFEPGLVGHGPRLHRGLPDVFPSRRVSSVDPHPLLAALPRYCSPLPDELCPVGIRSLDHVAMQEDLRSL